MLSQHDFVESDVDEIARYINEQGYPEAAERFIDAVFQTFRLLAKHPEIGSIYESGLADLDRFPIRSHTVPFPNRPSRRPYSVFYRIDGEAVRILYVYRTSQNIHEVMAEDVRT
ncbi:MAG: type II toxin-antitoxin system RelE/ParE family toxin [Verrucomicrobiota bacterium]